MRVELSVIVNEVRKRKKRNEYLVIKYKYFGKEESLSSGPHRLKFSLFPKIIDFLILKFYGINCRLFIE